MASSVFRSEIPISEKGVADGVATLDETGKVPSAQIPGGGGGGLTLGETSDTAYRGDRGAAAYSASVSNVDNAPTSGSQRLVTSNGVYAGLDLRAYKADLSLRIAHVTKSNVTINAGETTVDLSSSIPGGYTLFGIDGYINYSSSIYKLPWISAPDGQATSINTFTSTGTVKINNSSSSWGSCTLDFILFLKKNS